ncbi:hypothetical protein V8F33_009006 [Rhypophila sp. PSN 637]
MAYRSSAPDLAERPGDRSGRWERDRFQDRYGDVRERFEEDDDHVYSRRESLPPRAPPAPVRERSVPRYSSGGRGPPYEDDDLLFREQRRRVYEDDRIPIRRRQSPPSRFRSPSPPRRAPGSGGRPGMPLRRPSSLDTFDRASFDRREMVHREREREYSPAPRRDDFRAPPYMDIPLPRHKALPPPRFKEREYFEEEIRVSDPDRFGDDDFHGRSERVVSEKKIVKTRRRSRSRESRATRSFRSSSRSSSSSSSSATSVTTSRTGTTITARSEYPKKGKTRIPARLISRRALIDMEYPFVEEGNTIVIQKALGQQNIDDLLKLSDDYKKSERETEMARSLPGDIIEERRTTEIIIPARAPSEHSHHVTFEDTAPGQGGAPLVVTAPAPQRSVTPVQVQHTTTAVIRDVSPARTYTTSSYTSGSSVTSDSYSTTSYDSSVTAVPAYHHHHYGYPPGTAVSAYPPATAVREVSTEVPIGPVAIVDHRHRGHSRHRDSRSRSRHARHASVGRGGEMVRAERLSTGELVLFEETVERVEEPSKGVRIEKDRRGRMSISVPRNPR